MCQSFSLGRHNVRVRAQTHIHTHTCLLNPEMEAKTLGNYCTLLELPRAYELGDAYRSRDDSKHLHYGKVHHNMGGSAEAAIAEHSAQFSDR